MERMTISEIVKACEDLDGSKNRTAINKLFLRQDESNLWPINGRFNVTARAINRANKFRRESGQELVGLEYANLLDSIMSEIVNNPRNW